AANAQECAACAKTGADAVGERRVKPSQRNEAARCNAACALEALDIRGASGSNLLRPGRSLSRWAENTENKSRRTPEYQKAGAEQERTRKSNGSITWPFHVVTFYWAAPVHWARQAFPSPRPPSHSPNRSGSAASPRSPARPRRRRRASTAASILPSTRSTAPAA